MSTLLIIYTISAIVTLLTLIKEKLLDIPIGMTVILVFCPVINTLCATSVIGQICDKILTFLLEMFE